MGTILSLDLGAPQARGMTASCTAASTYELEFAGGGTLPPYRLQGSFREAFDPWPCALTGDSTGQLGMKGMNHVVPRTRREPGEGYK
jgi:hypothetical protein